MYVATTGSHRDPCYRKRKKKKNILKNQELKIAKIQDSTFLRTTEKKIKKKFERIQKWFEGGVAFWSFGSH